RPLIRATGRRRNRSCRRLTIELRCSPEKRWRVRGGAAWREGSRDLVARPPRSSRLAESGAVISRPRKNFAARMEARWLQLARVEGEAPPWETIRCSSSSVPPRTVARYLVALWTRVARCMISIAHCMVIGKPLLTMLTTLLQLTYMGLARMLRWPHEWDGLRSI
ncbi:hypothetical protein Dimus_035508, partial [Dionaea muscipula]